MLPRHLLARTAQRRINLTYSLRSLQPRLVQPSFASSFHSSSSTKSQNELPKSPFQTFVDVLKEELQKNRQLQDNVRQLQGDVDKLQDSEAMKRAKDMYERARLTSSIRENPRLRAAAEELKKAGGKVGDAVGEAIKSMDESEIMRRVREASSAVANTVSTATEPIRKTEAYKALADTVIEALDDSGSAKHAGYEEKEARRLRRQKRLAKAGKTGGIGKARTVENPDAGVAMVLHKDAEKREKWETLKETNPILRSFVDLRKAYDESENPVISSLRGVTESVSSFLFEETETAQVTRMFKTMDPSYDPETFQRELREYIIPEVVDAYLSADKDSLKMWCGEATYNVLWATLETYLKQGLISDSKVLDIRQVDVTAGKVLENNIPVLIVTCTTQEVLIFRDPKTKEIIVGQEDRVEQCTYGAILTRIPEEMDNQLTGGWKVVEMARRAARAYL
ncbi:protein translocase subunit [Serendipita sp. 401]|nr:protein translocase subunit [Serendipita sp. 397]KAG8822370.1 protein translocase subunit [Serendipita sp. 401]KAG8824430.1 protein translocase subunit [Serendipita sp. 400]KAG8836712.1 protein translocase subunit [Serendipita sp. 405]KAG9053660.1 protein translocase subunit [Serendipita sp. 407]